MKPEIKNFSQKEISSASTLRTILLFGRNVSTYKFALTSALLELKPNDEVKFTDLRNTFVKELLKHYQENPNQYQAGENQLTKAFDDYQTDKNWDKLISVAEKNIYNNVFDAFHNVGGSSISKEHILFEKDAKGKKIILTDNLNSLIEDDNLKLELENENQSRWRIVEEAWKNKLSPNLLDYNKEDGNFYSVNQHERVNIRSAVSALLPYQQGKCFYCNKKLNPEAHKDQHDFPDVDHFVPFSFFNTAISLAKINPNGVWNLVLACQECNRGTNGKFNSPPAKSYQFDLLERNILFTQEHKHSLKNSILLSLTAKSPKEVAKNMNYIFSMFDKIDGWKPQIIHT